MICQIERNEWFMSSLFPPLKYWLLIALLKLIVNPGIMFEYNVLLAVRMDLVLRGTHLCFLNTGHVFVDCHILARGFVDSAILGSCCWL
jgi:hypothetical protein